MAVNPITLLNGTTAYASDVETKVNPLYTDIDNSNIAAAAGIVASKIAGGTFAAGTYSFLGSTITNLGTVTTATFTDLTITTTWTASGALCADLGSVTTCDINGGTVDSLTSLGIRSSGAAFDLGFTSAEVLTASRDIDLDVGDADRAIVLPRDATLSGKILMSGQSETLDVNNYCNIIWKNPYASPTVTLTIVGGLFDPAHYTELREHSHANTAVAGNQSASHTHDVSGTSDGQSVTHKHTFADTSTNESADHSHTVDGGGGDGLQDEDGNNEFGRAQSYGATYGISKDGNYVANGRWIIPAHTHSVGGIDTNHKHDVSGTTGNASVDHTHSFSDTSNNQSASHNHTITVTPVNTGTTTAQALTVAEKDYLNGMTIWIDGVDRTVALLALATTNYAGQFAAFGDGTVGHRLNDMTLTSPGPGTGELDISTYVTTEAFHRIEFRQGGTDGGKLNWFLEVS